jgi:hypothetical protein
MEIDSLFFELNGRSKEDEEKRKEEKIKKKYVHKAAQGKR